MSWGFWAFVTGLAILPIIFFVILAIFYPDEETSNVRNQAGPQSRDEQDAISGGKHAA
jgi:hypothetical protein